MTALQVLFWLSVAWVAYSLFGYLALLAIVARFRQQPVACAEVTPTVSLLISARDEEQVIARKLENALALDYPRDRLEIVVVSDASSDRTDEIALGFAARGVRLHRAPDGFGKVSALNRAVPQTEGEILLFSDADSTYEPDALRALVGSFADPHVGAVTGEERRVPAAGQGLGEGLYARLDNQIKRLEGQIGSLDMVNGGFFAIRRSLYPVLEPHLIHDAIVPCLLALQGLRTAYEPQAASVESYALDAAADFRRRIRTVLQAFSSYLSVPAALNPFRTGWFAIEVLSHRFSRWFVIPWLTVALACSAALAGQLLYAALLAGQLLCYALALAGWLLDRSGARVRPLYFPYYYLYVHLAAFVAVVQALLGRRIAGWAPAPRV